MTTLADPKSSTPGLGTSILDRNLAALAGSGLAVERIRSASARADVAFLPTDDGVPSATLGPGESAVALASRRRPLEEGRRLAQTVPVDQAAGVVVMGFGLGYHVRALAERMKRTGVVIVFEPDVELLRAVLERVDHSAWLSAANVAILTDPDDAAAIAATIKGVEALLSLGVKFLEHPASRARLGDLAERFGAQFAQVMGAVRTTIVTTLMQAEVTLRNLLMNLDRYTTAPGVADLAGVAAGRPAVVVAAGPSLERNIDLLARPGVRDRVVIIAVQTVLKTLLKRGVRPHFVTALDYHEISRRFYEGLSAADVEGVTLVAEPKANPAILDAFPGAVRCPADPFLDALLGPSLKRQMGSLRAGATVAHMAHYLARHMGCDPVILVGQDLGFTDGQYYAAGAAIHEVWATELNPFNTLEMMEWQRIARARHMLKRATDHLGRPVWTDEQMHAYLVQFERDFLADTQRGLSVIDATEGGVAKRHTVALPLAEALERHAGAGPVAVPGTPAAASDAVSRRRIADRLAEVRRDVGKVAILSAKTRSLLQEMLDHQSDQPRVNRLIAKVDGLRQEVTALDPAFGLVQALNQTGVLKRVRADRQLGLAEGLPPLERQRRQIERDLTNVSWLADAAEQLGTMLDDAAACLAGAPKITRDPPPPDDAAMGESAEQAGEAAASSATRRVVALIPVDPERCGVGTRRSLAEPFLAGVNPLRATLRRLARCKELNGVLLLCEEPDAVRPIAGDPPAGLDVRIVRTPPGALAARRAAVRAARLWSVACWRGGLGGMTCYDEVLCPAAMAEIMEREGVDGAVLVGADWALVDPALVDESIEAYRQRRWVQGAGRSLPAVTFSQAPPGLGAAVVDRRLMADLASLEARGQGALATIGALLGYLPVAPMTDPIAKPVCAPLAADVRSLQLRCIPDSEARRLVMTSALGRLGEGALDLPASELTKLLREHDAGLPAGPLAPVPQQLVLELCTGRLTGGLRAAWLDQDADPVERAPLSVSLADRVLHQLGEGRSDAAVTFGGTGDPLLHPDWQRIVRCAKRAGIGAVHIRTDLVCGTAELDALLESGVDVISVDLLADSPARYRQITGADYYAKVRGNIEHLLSRRAAAAGGPPTPWIVPRITRCDAVYEEIESFYDRWLVLAGAAVIDPIPAPVAPQAAGRIRPLPKPLGAARRTWRMRMLALCDGRVPASEADLRGERTVGVLGGTPQESPGGRETLAAVWRRLCAYRQQVFRQHGAEHPDLWTSP